MRTIYSIILLPFFIVVSNLLNAQALNWANLKKDERHVANINVGVENGFVVGAGYSYKLGSKFPILLSTEVSKPFGKNGFDDYKIKIGGQIRVLETGSFNVGARVQGVFRRYESDYVRLLNFGSDMAVTAGFYKRKWFANGEAGFDKAIVTHFKHNDIFKSNFPGVQDGWYEPATGGNFYYGIQTGYSLKGMDIYLKAGKTVQQDFKTSSLVPFYAQAGINLKL